MSVRLMAEVFDRYPNGGGEMLLALALADHASDDGTSVYPKVKALAKKTRQSERTVQYQLRAMQDAGWLILVGSGHGGRSMSTEYRISPLWIKGANFAPIEKGAIHDTKGATDDTKGCNPQQERVQPVAPANNHHRTINEPLGNARKRAAPIAKPDDVDEQTWNDWLQLRKDKKASVTVTVLKSAITEAAKANIPLERFLQIWCSRGSQGLEASWLTSNERRATSATSNTNRYAGAAAAIFEDATHV